MPRNKDLKRLVRARMAKTGEAYAAARAQVLKKSPRPTTSRAATASRTVAQAPATARNNGAQSNYAALAGKSDAVISERTGRSWTEWVRTLDTHGAMDMRHGEIARIIHQQYGVGHWWAQTVTVGYERIKGLRAIGQRMDGTYEASKSRTYNVPVATLFDAWADANTRRKWLDMAGIKVRSATKPKAMRIGWPDGTVVIVGFVPKGTSKSAVAIAHTRLPDRTTTDQRKQYWTEQLDALGKVLTR